MKKLLKITLTLVITLIVVTGIIAPEILLSTPASPAVGNWYQQFMPYPSGGQLRDIHFINNDLGFAVTDSTIFKTTNSGNNWVSKLYGYYIFEKIKFINTNTGFICAGNNKLLKTINAGENWIPLTPSTIYPFDMAVLSEDTIWLADANSLVGGVFFTYNGGTNWVQQYSAGSQNPEKIYMYNARIGFISDNSGSSSIHKTTNGGLNWNMNVSGEWFKDIQFLDSLTGWRCMPSFDTATWVKKTTDGGITWIKQLLPTGGIIITSQINSLAVINKDTIWGSGGQAFYGSGRFRGILYKTINGGDTWKFQVPDTGFQIQGYGKIQFINKFTGWANANLQNIHTTNGGDTTFLIGLQQINYEVPKQYSLQQNYPNPFNPVTKIKFSITNISSVAQTFLSVYSITGKQVSTLINGQLKPGTYEIDFDASGLASGVYFYRLTVTAGREVYTETKKMVLLK